MAKKIVLDIEVDTNLEGVDKQINDIIGSTDTLNKKYKELKNAALEATDPEEFRKLAQAAGELKDRIDDTNRSINNFASDTQKLDVVVGSIRGIAGAFAAVQGTMALLGVENDNLQKSLIRVQSSLAILNGVMAVTDTLNKNSKTGAALYAASNKILAASIGTTTGALKAFRIALVATGLGAIVVALGLLVANFDKVKEAVLNLIPGLRIVGELFQQFTDFVGITSKVDREVDKLRRTTDRKIQTDKNELEVLKAKGATQEEVFEREKAILDEGIRSYEETIRLKGALNDVELEEYEKLIQQKKVLDAGYEKFRQDEAEKTVVEERKQADNAINVERRNQQRRIDLLNEGLSKRLAQIRLNYEKERAEAIKNGEDITLVEKNYRLQIFKAIEEQNSKIISETNTIQGRIDRLRGTTFRNTVQAIDDEKNAYVKAKLEELEGLKDVEVKKQRAINTTKKTENEARKTAISGNKERVDKIVNENKRLQKTNDDLIKSNKIVAEQEGKILLERQELEDKLIETQERAKGGGIIGETARGLLLLDFNIINLKKQIEEYDDKLKDLDKTYEGNSKSIEKNNKTLEVNEKLINKIEGSNSDLSKEIKKVGENYSVSTEKVDDATKEYSQNISLVIDKINELTELEKDIARREAIIDGLKAEQKFRDELGEDTLKLQLNIFNKEFDLYVENELRKVKSRLEAENAEEESIQRTLDTYRLLYERLRIERDRDVRGEDEARKLKKKLDELEKKSLDDRLKDERDYQIKRNAILASDGEVLINFKKGLELRELDRKLKKDLINNEIKFLQDKLKILEQDPSRNADEIKRINNTILKLSGDLLQDDIDLQLEKNDIIASSIREYVAGVENALSGLNDFIGGLAAESNDLLRQQQENNTKLLNEGKINQEEFNKLQDKATEDNEKRQEKLFYQQQNIEVVRTIISGLSSAQQAYQSQFLPVPDATSPVRGGIAAGIALGAATARVMAIKKQKFQRSGTSSAATPSLGSGRVVGGVSGSTMMEPTLRNDLDQSLRVFVLEGDITESQRRVRIVRGGANTTF